MPLPLILYERRSRWARQLRPFAPRWGVRLVETRTSSEAAREASQSACPVVLIEDPDGARALEAADSARGAAPGALILAIGDGDDFARIVRECGATLALPASSVPPRVVSVIARWIEIAKSRTSTLGWAADRRSESEPWQVFLQAAESPAPRPVPHPVS